jgi:hypothetical protein
MRLTGGRIASAGRRPYSTGCGPIWRGVLKPTIAAGLNETIETNRNSRKA